jgi:predicted glycogen debranching enzyme
LSIAVAPEILQSWELCSRHEWLVTNGIGGYASDSLAGANTRRYHGLLVAAIQPPLGRTILLSKLEEEVRIEDELYYLSTNKYPSVLYPQGYRHLVKVSCEPVLTFLYSMHEHSVLLQKQVWMPHGHNTVMVHYTLLKAPEPIRFGLVPFMAYKDYHTEQHRWDGFTGRTEVDPSGAVRFQALDSAIPIRFGTWPVHAYPFNADSGWFYNYEHEREEERGLEYSEDLFCPGRFDGLLAPGKSATFYATIEDSPPIDPIESLRSEAGRVDELIAAAKLDPREHKHEALHYLLRAADQFVVESSPRVSRSTIIAGYHWFTDWGRDTFIALPGLCLSTGRAHVAKNILASFAGSVQQGLIPNRFTDNGVGAEYNTVDATLWYIYAAHEYALATDDWDFLTNDLLPLFEQILDAHERGTLHNIHVDPSDGLLYAGEPGVQLTWMDAKVGEWVVTPRVGKPVEIQALFYNALLIVGEVLRRAGRAVRSSEVRKGAAKLHDSFLAKFVDHDRGLLHDVVDVPNQSEPDKSVRPNQIFAVSLHHALIAPDTAIAKRIISTVQDRLYTEFGLRTLDPADPNYKGLYGPGDPSKRDAAYHQGTVWPWLLGPFIEAHFKVFGNRAASMDLLSPLLRSLPDYGFGTIGEVFDGDFPHAPNGCIAQAWSVAEALRAYTLLTKTGAATAEDNKVSAISSGVNTAVKPAARAKGNSAAA